MQNWAWRWLIEEMKCRIVCSACNFLFYFLKYWQTRFGSVNRPSYWFFRFTPVHTGLITWLIQLTTQTGHATGSWFDRSNRPVRAGMNLNELSFLAAFLPPSFPRTKRSLNVYLYIYTNQNGICTTNNRDSSLAQEWDLTLFDSWWSCMEQGFKYGFVTVKKAATKRYKWPPIPFLPVFRVRWKITPKCLLRPRQTTDTTVKLRYECNTPLRKRKT